MQDAMLGLEGSLAYLDKILEGLVDMQVCDMIPEMLLPPFGTCPNPAYYICRIVEHAMTIVAHLP